jgi:polyhydroxyalkanoate synthesis regulator phasin
MRLDRLPLQPVWQQLREMLDKSPANISWARRMEQQQQDISRLQQQVAQLQRRNAALEQQWDAVQGHH